MVRIFVISYYRVLMHVSRVSGMKPQTIRLLFATPLVSMDHYGARSKTGCLGIIIMCLKGPTWLIVDCCDSIRINHCVFI